MEHVNGLREFGHVQDAIFSADANTDLGNTAPDAAHRLPVPRCEALLNPVELEPGSRPCIVRKPLEVLASRAEANDRLECHREIYTKVYITASCQLQRSSDGNYNEGCGHIARSFARPSHRIDQNTAAEEQQSTHCMMLRRWSELFSRNQHSRKRLHLNVTALSWIPPVAKPHITLDPLDVSLFGARTLSAHADRLADKCEQLRWARIR